MAFLTAQEVSAGQRAGLKEKSHTAKKHLAGKTGKLFTSLCTNILA